MYYLNIIIETVQDRYKLFIIQKSYTNDIELKEEFMYHNVLKSSDRFSQIEIKGIYQDILKMCKDIGIKANLVNMKYENGYIKKVNYIEFYCDEDEFEIVSNKLTNQLGLHQVFHQYIEVPIESESTEEMDTLEEEPDEEEFTYY
jgi:hypothetical protein